VGEDIVAELGGCVVLDELKETKLMVNDQENCMTLVDMSPVLEAYSRALSLSRRSKEYLAISWSVMGIDGVDVRCLVPWVLILTAVFLLVSACSAEAVLDCACSGLVIYSCTWRWKN
jgi:hypothetical protein